jgi:hypothetical protein
MSIAIDRYMIHDPAGSGPGVVRACEYGCRARLCTDVDFGVEAIVRLTVVVVSVSCRVVERFGMSHV